jgi:hypothetical protein
MRQNFSTTLRAAPELGMMNINRIVLAMLSCLGLLLAGCGKQVPQNKLALLVKTLGARTTTNATASAEVYWARRLPFGVSANPGIRVFTFPLGLQEYEFSQAPSYESPNDEAIEVDCLGGHLKFDVNIQLYLDKEMPGLAEKLLQFINDHQLQGYSGEHDMLARWAGEKLRQFVREPLAQYALNKQVIEIMRNKKEMNDVLINRMNERFNKYGLRFSSAGISSEVRIPQDQKERMNAIVTTEYANRTLQMRSAKLMPLLSEINEIEQNGLTQSQDKQNFGSQEEIRILAEAQQQRRQMFSSLVGETNYVALEQMLTMVKNLNEGQTKVLIVPKSMLYLAPSVFEPANTQKR